MSPARPRPAQPPRRPDLLSAARRAVPSLRRRMTAMRLPLLLPLLLLPAAASAGPAAEAWSAALPLQATLDRTGCPAGAEVLRVELPPALRGVGEAGNGSDLFVQGADGERVPAIYVREAPQPETRRAVQEPSTDPTQYLLASTDRPVDGLRLSLGRRKMAVTARVWRRTSGGLVPHGAPKLLWRTDGREDTDLYFPPTREPLELRLEWHHGWGGGAIGVEHLILQPDAAAPQTLRLPIRSQWVEETGLAHYTVDLPHPIPPAQLRLVTDAPVFARELVVNARVGATQQDEQLGRGQLVRVQLGGASVDEQAVQLDLGTSSDRLHLQVMGDGQVPLTVTAVELTLPGEALLLYRPPAGALTLRGGGPMGVVPPSDIAVAAPELGRMSGCTAAVGPIEPNPTYVPIEVASGLTDAGQTFDPANMRWAWNLDGDGQLALLRLPASVAALSRNSMNDLRILNSSGQQVPYILRRSDLRQSVEGVQTERSEDGKITRFVIKNPQPDLLIEAVSLRSGALAMNRTVNLKRPAGGSLEFLRLSTLSFAAAPGAVRPEGGRSYSLALGQAVGDTLVLEIDNGDDAPLPVEGIELWTEGYELLTAIPEGGATLYLGDRKVGPPEHDLSMLTGALQRRNLRVVELGAPEERSKAPVSKTELAAVWAGLLVMVGGMASLLVMLAKGAPPAPAEPAPPAA